MDLFNIDAIIIQPKWLTEEKARIIFKDVCVRPPIAPTKVVQYETKKIKINLWLKLFSKKSGAIFCKVMIMRDLNQSSPLKMIINQEWNGKAPSLINKGSEIRRVFL